MGIRFRCPNGHKLHVKSFLAGKRGICPQCGVKLVIPLESDPVLVQNPKPVSAENGTPPETAGSVADAEAPSPGPEALSSGTSSETAGAVVEAPHVAEPSRGIDAVKAPDEPQPISGDSADPIGEAPHALWYVQPPSGGQYGPASGDIMRTWISEGRVTRDSLVWREGWSDWKLAGPLFPGLVSGPAVVEDSGSVAIVTEPAEGSIAERYRRKKSNRTALFVVILLVIACLILFATLIYVIKFMS
jgi:hypothetical protein